MNVRPLIKTVFTRFFGPSVGLCPWASCACASTDPCAGFMDMIRDHVPSPVANAANKIQHIYAGALSSSVARDMLACNPDGELMVQITKLYPSQDASTFDAFGRVLSGTIERGSTVKVCLLSEVVSSIT